jgi:hypothetical protein
VARPGKLVRKPLERAEPRVERADENRAAWAKVTRPAGVAEPMAMLASAMGLAGDAEGMSRCQRRVRAARWPVRMILALWLTATVALVKATVQPASQNWPMEIRDFESRAGTMWTWQAASGKLNKLSSAVWVEHMMLPLGLEKAMGVVARRLLMTGVSLVQKWAVLPVSAMARVESRTGVRGPSTGTEVGANLASLLASCELLSGERGFPPFQGGGLTAGPRGGPCLGQVMRRALPPIMLAMVAWSLCPLALFLHLGLVCRGFSPIP